MENKTAVKELFEKYGHLLPNIEEEYIKKEKEQITNACKEFDLCKNEQDWIDYYNDKYNK